MRSEQPTPGRQQVKWVAQVAGDRWVRLAQHTSINVYIPLPPRISPLVSQTIASLPSQRSTSSTIALIIEKFKWVTGFQWAVDAVLAKTPPGYVVGWSRERTRLDLIEVEFKMRQTEAKWTEDRWRGSSFWQPLTAMEECDIYACVCGVKTGPSPAHAYLCQWRIGDQTVTAQSREYPIRRSLSRNSGQYHLRVTPRLYAIL